jgi:glycosyltransferase involved in cell wall biosynthesis
MTGSVNFFSPFPPTRSGVSDYSLAIVANLARDNDILAIVKTAEEKAFLREQGIAAEFAGRATRPAATNIFQIGNSGAHDYIFNAALGARGIVVIHDLFLHGLVKAATLAHSNVAEYNAIMRCEGPQGELIADRTLLGDFKPIYSSFLGGHRALVRGAEHVIVHCDWAAQMVKADNPDVPVHVIPHFCTSSGRTGDRQTRIQQTRVHFNISPDAFVLSHFGFLNDSKQSNLLIRIALLLQDRIDLHLLIAGSGSRDLLSTQKANLSLVRNKSIVDHLPEALLDNSILASNLISLLRYPSSGETSGIGARCLSVGRPVICFDYYAYSDFPRDVAIHIPVDTMNAEAAADAIFMHIKSPDFMEQREAAALRWAEGAMHISRVTEAYNEVIDACR